jgi:DNA polymerase-3 subunit epsilon
MSRLLFIDCETTGVDPYADRIVEICLHRPGELDMALRINPGVPIPAEASEVHGITDEDVRDAPRFDEIALHVQELVTGAVLVGYNCRRFDTVLIDAELQRAGQPGLERGPDGKICTPEIDLYALWQRHEERTLIGAAKRFAGVDLENAHSAEADTLVLPQVLAGMVATFGLSGAGLDELCALCIAEGAVDRDGKFLRREDGVIVYNFSQKKGTPVSEDLGLLRWMLGKDFSRESKDIARALLAKAEQPKAVAR